MRSPRVQGNTAVEVGCSHASSEVTHGRSSRERSTYSGSPMRSSRLSSRSSSRHDSTEDRFVLDHEGAYESVEEAVPVRRRSRTNRSERRRRTCPLSRTTIVVAALVVIGTFCGAYNAGLAACFGNGPGGSPRERATPHAASVNLHDQLTRGGDSTTMSLEQRLLACSRDVPSWFTGQSVYRAAAHDLSMPVSPHTPVIFLEIGGYLGQSTVRAST